jgi:Fic family protein
VGGNAPKRTTNQPLGYLKVGGNAPKNRADFQTKYWVPMLRNNQFSIPLINAVKVERVVGKSAVSAYKLISDMEDLGILKEITGGQRRKMHMFEEYVKLFK